MDPKLTTDERKMREEMLQHEFPFDEKAWASMEALLNQDKQKPLAGPPVKRIETQPGPARNWPLVLLLLFSFGLGASTLIWWNSKSDSLRSDANRGSTVNLIRPGGSIEANEIKSSLGNSALSNIEKEAELKSKPENEPPLVSGTNRQSRGQKVSTNRTLSNYVFNTPTTSDVEIDKPPAESSLKATTPPLQIPGGNDLSPAKTPIDQMPISRAKDADALEFIDETLLPLPALLEIPYLTKPPKLDSLVQPIKMLPASISRMERGWIFGLNANTVDHAPLRLSVLPHLGYFVNYRYRPRTVLQAEFVAKYVSGYQLHAEFIDIIPGGSSIVILNSNNLLFLEFPLVVKHRFKPEQSWLLGIKPAWGVAIAPYGSTSYFNNAPGRIYDSQAGIRHFDLGLVFGWEWRFHTRWAFDIRYNQGLFDLTHDQFYKDNSIHLNSDLQVSLRYLWRKKTRHHAPKTLFPVPAGR